jgi:hypothetical protein
MRILPAALFSALVLSAALPAQAQYYDDADLPGVRVTIQPRSYLDPGNKVRPMTGRDYAKSNLTGNTFLSSNYEGIPGFGRYPLHDPLDLPYTSMPYVLKAPDRIR